MTVPDPHPVTWVLLWIIYIAGVIWLGSTLLFVTMLAVDEYQFRRRQRRIERAMKNDGN